MRNKWQRKIKQRRPSTGRAEMAAAQERVRNYVDRTHDAFMAQLAQADEWAELECGAMAGPLRR
ncbi:MAG: hypothetical protein KKH74_01505 [Gammaproteobacteria bacterium]|nr:hypothetical protein [Gammaproteobacteria bacterium]MBU1732500.1 hypothetical protein [Gammaproteobacteria bacterium]MBU1892636.1 hypothetical protein [Gammaproteobacteria bacterium]